MPTDTDDLPNIDMDHPVRVTFGKEPEYGPTLAELIRCRRHRDGTLQSVLLPEVGPNTPYPSGLKGTHRRYTDTISARISTAVWAAA